jgi:hypothetical protein
MRIRRTLLVSCVLTALGAAATVPATRPAGIELTAVLNKETYRLNPAQSGKEFRDRLAQIRGRAPVPSEVDVTLQFTNNSAAPITLPFGGDDSTFHFKLEGEGAVNIPNNVPMTREFRMGQPVTIDPGKTITSRITTLAGGMRGMTEFSYFTEPGEYTLNVSFEYTKDNQRTTIAARPIKFKVVRE